MTYHAISAMHGFDDLNVHVAKHVLSRLIMLACEAVTFAGILQL